MARQNSRTLIRKRVWEKSGGICVRCGNRYYGNHQTIDHFIPKSKGGENHMDNLVPLCAACNKLRANRKILPEEFYVYASEDIIKGCRRYKRRWIRTHISMDNHIYTL